MSRIGADLVEAFEEMAAHLRGEIEVESYEVPADVLTRRRFGTFVARWRGARRHSKRTSRFPHAPWNPMSRAAESPMQQ